jgi:hypothetical protein
MQRIGLITGFSILIVCGTVTLLQGQFGFRRFFNMPENDPPPTELIIVRWRYGTNGMIGHTGWSHNYPTAEMHLNELIAEITSVDVDPMSYRTIQVGSDEVFDYPFAFVAEPGEMALTDHELNNFRQYIDRGGFVLVDDFDGRYQFENFQSEMKRAFPDRELQVLTISDPIFHTFYDIQSLEIFQPYVPGATPVFLGLLNKDGVIALVAAFNNDLANFWDWIDLARYPLEPSSEAFRMGINFVLYAMTH